MFNKLTAVNITVIYAAVAGLWIVFTDRAIELLVTDPATLTSFQTYKGWFYVIVTSIGLYLLIKKHDAQVKSKEQKLEDLSKLYQSEEELLEKLFDRIPVMVTLYNPRMDNIRLNKEFEKVTGWSQQDAREINLLNACYPDPKYRKEVIEFMNTPGSGWKEFPITSKSGDQIESSWTNIRLSDNTQVGIGIDLSDIKKSEARLRESQQLLRKTFDSLEESVIILKPESRKILDCNRATEQMFGYSRNELIGNSIKSLHLDEEKFREFDEMGKEALRREGKFQTEFRLKRKNGNPFSTVHTVSLLYDENGKPYKVVSVIRDITERKRAMEALKESEKRYRLMFENSPEPLWIYDPDTLAFIEVNHSAIQHYGYSNEEFLSMTLPDIHPDADVERMKQDIKEHRGKASYGEEWVHIKKDGSWIDVEISAVDIRYNNETYRLVMANDITDQKRVRDRIIQSAVEGEDRERKRIAHELHDGLGQYLVAANMNFESIKSNIQELSPKREKQFKTGLSLLKQALSETRNISYNLMPKVIEDYGLITAVENLVENFRSSSKIKFHFSHEIDNLNLKDQAEINLYRILQELLSNAVRHADCSSIHVSFSRVGGVLVGTVEDDGKGLELHEELEHKGLGLRSIKTRINALKGKIEMESKPGEGMKTTFIIPVTGHISEDRNRRHDG